jgi:hypothetical protein
MTRVNCARFVYIRFVYVSEMDKNPSVGSEENNY